MREEAQQKAALEEAAVQQHDFAATVMPPPVRHDSMNPEAYTATVVPPARHDSMNPEDEDQDVEPNRPVLSQGVQTEQEKPKKVSLLRRVSRVFLRR
jgi:hypothetical protein